jgi:phosphohistidine phosphatase
MLSHLLLMRHAKSSWANPDQSDHARPLNKRGRASADAVGRVLHSRGYSPDLIWASDSMRTKETAQRLVRIIPGAQMAVYEAGFYHASAEQVLNLCDQHGEPESGDGSAVKLIARLTL